MAMSSKGVEESAEVTCDVLDVVRVGSDTRKDKESSYLVGDGGKSWRTSLERNKKAREEFDDKKFARPSGSKDTNFAIGEVRSNKMALCDENRRAAWDLRAKLRGEKDDSATELNSKNKDNIVKLGDMDIYNRSIRATHTRNVDMKPARIFNDRNERENYFHDDESYSLRDLYEQHRKKAHFTTNGLSEMDAVFARNIIRKGHGFSTGVSSEDDGLFDENSEVEYGAWSGSRRRRRSATYSDEFGMKNRAIQTYKMDEKTRDCIYCPQNTDKIAHLILANGDFNSILMVERGALTRFHCMIVPHEHNSSCTSMEDNEWGEVLELMDKLTRFFQIHFKLKPIFLETVLNTRSLTHTVVECIPIPMDLFGVAPTYFQKSIVECGSEWNTNNKLLVWNYNVRAPSFDGVPNNKPLKRTIRETIPQNFDYFMVKFGMDFGFAHHIENRKKFCRNLGRQVICGILGLPMEDVVFKQRNKPIGKLKEEILEFMKLWSLKNEGGE